MKVEAEMEYDAVYIFKLYIKVVDELINIRIGNNDKRIYVITQSNNIYNFRAEDFRRHLEAQLTGIRVNDILRIFRTLQLIIARDDKFTNVQRINNKSVKVISIDIQKHELLKSLKWE